MARCDIREVIASDLVEDRVPFSQRFVTFSLCRLDPTAQLFERWCRRLDLVTGLRRDALSVELVQLLFDCRLLPRSSLKHGLLLLNRLY